MQKYISYHYVDGIINPDLKFNACFFNFAWYVNNTLMKHVVLWCHLINDIIVQHVSLWYNIFWTSYYRIELADNSTSLMIYEHVIGYVLWHWWIFLNFLAPTTWNIVYRWAINLHNVGLLASDLSLMECQDLCSNDPRCRSIDFTDRIGSGECLANDVTRLEAGSDWLYYSFYDYSDYFLSPNGKPDNIKWVCSICVELFNQIIAMHIQVMKSDSS